MTINSNPNRTWLYSLGTNLFYEELSSRRRSIFLLEGWSPSCCGIWNNFCRGHFESAPCWATSHKDCMFCRLVIPNGGKTRLGRAGLDYAGPRPAGGNLTWKKIILLRWPHIFYFTAPTQPPPCQRLWKHLNNKYEQKLDVPKMAMKKVIISCVIRF